MLILFTVVRSALSKLLRVLTRPSSRFLVNSVARPCATLRGLARFSVLGHIRNSAFVMWIGSEEDFDLITGRLPCPDFGRLALCRIHKMQTQRSCRNVSIPLGAERLTYFGHRSEQGTTRLTSDQEAIWWFCSHRLDARMALSPAGGS